MRVAVAVEMVNKGQRCLTSKFLSGWSVKKMSIEKCIDIFDLLTVLCGMDE